MIDKEIVLAYLATQAPEPDEEDVRRATRKYPVPRPEAKTPETDAALRALQNYNDAMDSYSWPAIAVT